MAILGNALACRVSAEVSVTTLLSWKGSDSDSANLRQRYVSFHRCALYSNGKDFFTFILDLEADPDYHQNLITSKLG